MMDAKELLYMARIAEQAERFEDMIGYMKKYLEISKDLKDMEKRNLLFNAYKMAVLSRRNASRTIAAFETKEKTKNSRQIEVINYYKTKVEKELENFCLELLAIIDQTLLKHPTDLETKVLYLKTKADYYRYISEIYTGENFKRSSENASKFYQAAIEVFAERVEKGEKIFPATNPIRLGLALNYSIFQAEIKHDPKSAMNIAKKAFEEALNEFDNMIDEEMKVNAASVMQTLKENIAAWKEDLGEVIFL